MGATVFAFSSDQDCAFEANLLTTLTYHTLFHTTAQAECANWISWKKTEVEEAFQACSLQRTQIRLKSILKYHIHTEIQQTHSGKISAQTQLPLAEVVRK